MNALIKQPFQLIPEYRDYVWGGKRLRPDVGQTAEAWIVYEGDQVKSGAYAGRTLKELATEFGGDLLGSRASGVAAGRFPVLVKMLDCADWLSLQVHPDDAQAARLEGPGSFGKTEAWQVLSAEPGATLIAGVNRGTDAATLSAAIRSGEIVQQAQSSDIRTGDTLFIEPGTIHALGPGLLIYEIQQTSDITYRVYDWGRPETEKRRLHIDKAIAVSRADAQVEIGHLPALADGDSACLCSCPFFSLDMLYLEKHVVSLDTRGETFHALTSISGQAEVVFGEEKLSLGLFETIFIPANCGAYQVRSLGACRILRASL